MKRGQRGANRLAVGPLFNQGERSKDSVAYPRRPGILPATDLRRMLDLSGRTFGRWTVLRFAHRDANRKDWWHCRCACGTERVVIGQDLRRAVSLSCGCLRAEQLAQRNTARAGRGRTPEQTREAERLRKRRPRPPCPCRWCSNTIEAPIKNQCHCSAECAWQSVLATDREKPKHLTAEQRAARAAYQREWKKRFALDRLTADAAELNRRLTDE